MGMIEGAVIAVVSILIGRFLRGRHRDKPVKPVCGCTHDVSFHEGGTGICHADGGRAPVKFYNSGEVAAWGPVQCTCQIYSGPEPLPEMYSRGIAS